MECEHKQSDRTNKSTNSCYCKQPPDVWCIWSKCIVIKCCLGIIKCCDILVMGLGIPSSKFIPLKPLLIDRSSKFLSVSCDIAISYHALNCYCRVGFFERQVLPRNFDFNECSCRFKGCSVCAWKSFGWEAWWIENSSGEFGLKLCCLSGRKYNP